MADTVPQFACRQCLGDPAVGAADQVPRTVSADALEALGVSVELTPDQGRQLIEQVGISFLYAPNFHPIMLKVFFTELALGIKTIFFTIIGPLINPAGAPHHMMGVYKPELVPMVGDVVAQLDMNHVIVAHGSGGPGDTAGAGLDEISILGPTSIAEVTGDTVEHYTITPGDCSRASTAPAQCMPERSARYAPCPGCVQCPAR